MLRWGEELYVSRRCTAVPQLFKVENFKFKCTSFMLPLNLKKNLAMIRLQKAMEKPCHLKNNLILVLQGIKK